MQSIARAQRHQKNPIPQSSEEKREVIDGMTVMRQCLTQEKDNLLLSRAFSLNYCKCSKGEKMTEM